MSSEDKSAEWILGQLDQSAEDFTFPDLGHGYSFAIDARLCQTLVTLDRHHHSRSRAGRKDGVQDRSAHRIAAPRRIERELGREVAHA